MVSLIGMVSWSPFLQEQFVNAPSEVHELKRNFNVTTTASQHP